MNAVVPWVIGDNNTQSESRKVLNRRDVSTQNESVANRDERSMVQPLIDQKYSEHHKAAKALY